MQDARDTDRWQPTDEAGLDDAVAALEEWFGPWAADRRVSVEAASLQMPLHYKHAYIDGHLTRWTCDDLDELFLEVYPRKVVADGDGLGDMVDEVRALIQFLADTGLLADGSDPPEVLVAHLASLERPFVAHMADGSRGSFGKQLWSQALAEGVSLDDQASVDAFIARFNARPFDERTAALGLGGPARRSGGRATPTGTPPRPRGKRHKRR